MQSFKIKHLSRRTVTLSGAAAVASALSFAAAAQSVPPATPTVTTPPPAVGLWLDHTGRGAVEISECGGALCGRIVWLKEPTDKAGNPLRDILNEDRSKRTRPICGLQIIGDVRPQRDGSWDAGWIYDPEQGEAFDVELRMRGPDALQVKGYKGLKFLSQTFQWRRIAEAPAPKCS